MSTITILPPIEQNNLYTDALRFNSNENKRTSTLLHESPYQVNSINSANSFSKNNFTWEYFSNELEFE